MKKYFIFTAILATLVMGLVACNDESTPVAKDDSSSDVNAGGDVPIGGPLVMPEADIPVEDEAEPEADKDKPEKKNGVAEKKDSAVSSDAQVKILKSSKTFGKLVLGNHYKFTVMAKGKDVAMSASGLPPGLIASSPATSNKTLNIEGVPTETGEYPVTIEAHSTSDLANKDEKQFTMKIVENLALNAYKLGLNDEGEWMWMRIEETEGLTIPPGEVIRLEARTVTDEDDAAEDDVIEGETAKADSDKTENSDGGDDEDPAADEPSEAAPESSDVDEDAHASDADVEKAAVESDGTSAGKADKYFWSLNDVECSNDECEQDGLILTAANPFAGEKPTNNSVRYLTASSSFIGKTIKKATLKTWNVNGDEDHITLASLVFESDPCDAPLALSISDIKFNKKEFRRTTKFSAHIDVASGKAPFKWEIVDSPAGPVNFASKSGTGTSNTMTVDGEFTPPKELTYNKLKEGWEFVSKIRISDACTPSRSVDGTITVNLKDDTPPTPKVSELSIKIDFGEINDTSSDGAYDEDTTYMYVYLLNGNDQELGRVYYDLEPCGDGGDEDNCEGEEPVDTDTKWTEDKKAVLTDIKKVKIKFHDDVCFLCGDVDINIKKIEIFSIDWIAIYDDGNNGDRYDDDVVGSEWRTDDITDKMEGYVDDPLDMWHPKSDDDEATSQGNPEDGVDPKFVAKIIGATATPYVSISEIAKDTGASDTTAKVSGAVVDPAGAAAMAVIDSF